MTELTPQEFEQICRITTRPITSTGNEFCPECRGFMILDKLCRRCQCCGYMHEEADERVIGYEGYRGTTSGMPPHFSGGGTGSADRLREFNRMLMASASSASSASASASSAPASTPIILTVDPVTLRGYEVTLRSDGAMSPALSITTAISSSATSASTRNITAPVDAVLVNPECTSYNVRATTAVYFEMVSTKRGGTMRGMPRKRVMAGCLHFAHLCHGCPLETHEIAVLVKGTSDGDVENGIETVREYMASDDPALKIDASHELLKQHLTRLEIDMKYLSFACELAKALAEPRFTHSTFMEKTIRIGVVYTLCVILKIPNVSIDTVRSDNISVSSVLRIYNTIVQCLSDDTSGSSQIRSIFIKYDIPLCLLEKKMR